MRPPLSPARRVGEVLVTSGLTARVAGDLISDELEGQARHVLATLGRLLDESGLEPGDVFAVNVFLADIKDLPAFNEVYCSFFREPYPTRTTIQCGLGTGVLVELNAQAARSSVH